MQISFKQIALRSAPLMTRIIISFVNIHQNISRMLQTIVIISLQRSFDH